MATDAELATAIGNLVIPTDVSDLTDTTNLLEHFSGDYGDLTNKPTIPTVPTNVSAFTNDSGYLTAHQDLSAYALQTQLFSGSYTDLTNKPTIPTVPTNISSFTNDSGYITSYTDTTYSQATNTTLGLVKIGYSENGKNYPVELSNGQMFVNVPWTDTNTDTNTTYSAGTGLDLTGTEFSIDSTIATTSYVDTAVANIVDTAPTALNTLNELAAALGDDPNFATTISTSIGNKVSTGSSEYLKGVTYNSSGDILTFTRGDDTTFQLDIVDNNSNTYVTGASFNTTDGVLTLTRNSGSVTVDLDGRYSQTDTNTTYTAGNGLTLTGTEFSMSGSYTGTFTASGDVCAYSDVRLKNNIFTIDNALEKVSKLRGVIYEKDSKESIGVIAQEVEEVIPEVVNTDSDGIKSVAYGNMVGLLIEAIKELTEQNRQMAEEIKQLKNKP